MRHPRPITKTQQKVLDYIKSSSHDCGYGWTGDAPTSRQIAAHFGWKSEHSSRCHIKALIHKGFLKKGPRGRAQVV